MFTAEYIYPLHFEDDPGLRPYAAVASALAEHPWPRVFDFEVLATLDVPCAEIIHVDDPYVGRVLSEETAAKVPALRPWLTHEYLHNGLRFDGNRIVDRLIRLANRST